MNHSSPRLGEAAAAAVAVQPAYRPDIDGLRAIAVLAVVLFHAFPGKLLGGFVGVDVFFVISGYLIGTILIGNLQQGTFSFAEFFARRIRRIFPALLLVMGSCLAFGWFALFPDEFAQLGKHVLGGAAFVANFVLWNEMGYFDTAAETKPLLHLWSLGIEEQFYIVWPLVLFIAAKCRVSLFKTALVLGAASFLFNVSGVYLAPNQYLFTAENYYSPASRAWELLAGAGLAWMTVNGYTLAAVARRRGGDVPLVDFASPRVRNVQSVAGLLLIAVAALALDRGFPFPGWWALMPVGGALLLIAAGPQAWVNRHLLARPLLVGVGLISYPLYLWHWPLLSFARIFQSGIPTRGVKLACLAAAFALAWLTWRAVERPLRGSRHGAAKVAALVLAMAALAAGGGAVMKGGGLPQRPVALDNADLQKDLIMVEDTANVEACKRRHGFTTVFQYCLMHDVDKPPTVVMVGDSHAYHIVAGQMKYWAGKGENLLYLGTRVPFFDLPDANDGDEYQKATPRMLDIALKTPGVKTVIISTAMLLRQTKAEKELYLLAFRATVDKFTRAGREIIFVIDNPTLGFDPRACIRRSSVAGVQPDGGCTIPRAELDAARANNADFGAVLRDHPEVKVFDPASALCDDKVCRIVIDGALMYRDHHHFSYRGDLRVGEAFARWREGGGR